MKRKQRRILEWTENYYRRYCTRLFEKRAAKWRIDQPVVSFTFDDFPRSAFRVGGTILRKHGVCGSFYASFGLLGSHTPAGDIFIYEDLLEALKAGHEIGCHTYDHLDAWKSRADIFEASIRKNMNFLRALCPGKPMWTFSYPRSQPHPRIKAIAAKYFLACRGGGQINNKYILDLNLIRSCFIDQKNCGDLDILIELINKNAKEGYWLVFSTHDIGSVVSPYGCPTDVFEEIVAKSVESKSLVLPIIDVCSRLTLRKR